MTHWRSFTVAKVDSMGLVVRRCFYRMLMELAVLSADLGTAERLRPLAARTGSLAA